MTKGSSLSPSSPHFLLSQTLLGGEEERQGEERREKKHITEKTDVVSGERARYRVEDKEVK